MVIYNINHKFLFFVLFATNYKNILCQKQAKLSQFTQYVKILSVRI